MICLSLLIGVLALKEPVVQLGPILRATCPADSSSVYRGRWQFLNTSDIFEDKWLEIGPGFLDWHDAIAEPPNSAGKRLSSWHPRRDPPETLVVKLGGQPMALVRSCGLWKLHATTVDHRWKVVGTLGRFTGAFQVKASD